MTNCFDIREYRRWHKVQWVKDMPTKKGLAGKADLIPEESFVHVKDFVKVISTVVAKKCTAGLSLEYGRCTEAQVDEWMNKNRIGFVNR